MGLDQTKESSRDLIVSVDLRYQYGTRSDKGIIQRFDWICRFKVTLWTRSDKGIIQRFDWIYRFKVTLWD